MHTVKHAYCKECSRLRIYPWQALKIPVIFDFVRDTMLQAADILTAVYPEEFSIDSLSEHINDLLFRFGNKYLGDTIFRVGCDLFRKLGPEDRIVGGIRMAQKMKMPYDKILYILVCACHFRATDEEGKMLEEDVEFVSLYEKGLKSVLTSVCGFDEPGQTYFD
jgi:mannitol-1-phosphate 5-dehydrogenase